LNLFVRHDFQSCVEMLRQWRWKVHQSPEFPQIEKTII
jgi:hypothetical protein